MCVIDHWTKIHTHVRTLCLLHQVGELTDYLTKFTRHVLPYHWTKYTGLCVRTENQNKYTRPEC